MTKKELGRRLKQARGDRTAREIAQRAGQLETTYGRWENGVGSLSAVELIDVCAALGVSVSAILDEAEELRAPKDMQIKESRLIHAMRELEALAPDADPDVWTLCTDHVRGLSKALRQNFGSSAGASPAHVSYEPQPPTHYGSEGYPAGARPGVDGLPIVEAPGEEKPSSAAGVRRPRKAAPPRTE